MELSPAHSPEQRATPQMLDSALMNWVETCIPQGTFSHTIKQRAAAELTLTKLG